MNFSFCLFPLLSYFNIYTRTNRLSVDFVLMASNSESIGSLLYHHYLLRGIIINEGPREKKREETVFFFLFFFFFFLLLIHHQRRRNRRLWGTRNRTAEPRTNPSSPSLLFFFPPHQTTFRLVDRKEMQSGRGRAPTSPLRLDFDFLVFPLVFF